MSDEGLREIHLNGKQLVFLFMSATVVAVVIFLCGVLVGQGVRGEQARLAAAVDDSADPTTLDGDVAVVPAPPEGTRSTNERFTYPNLLEGQDVPVERLSVSAGEAPLSAARESAPQTASTPPTAAATAATTRASSSAASASRVAPTARRAAAATAAAAPAAGEPPGNGFVVQVAAVRERAEADDMARRLTAKGYPAFVTSPAGPARIFRVRVGKFSDRREAESVAGRLQREEQFKPWITR